MASGMLVLVPLGVTLLVVGWLFRLSASLLRPVVSYATRRLEQLHWIQTLPEGRADFYVSVLAVLLLLVLLYLVGGLGQHLIGRRLIAAWEAIWMKIPLARSIYSATKQVMEALSQPQGGCVQVGRRRRLPLSGPEGHRLFDGVRGRPRGSSIR